MAIVGILDGQNIQALSLAKQLRKKGHYVILFCNTKRSYGYFCRYANKKVISPSPKNRPEEFHEFFMNYLKNNELDVVIPTSDYSAKYLSKNKSLIQNKVQFSIPEYAIFMTGYDKNKLMEVCQINNIPHPRTIDLSKLSIGQEIREFNFPALIKPNQTSGAIGFTRVDSFKEVWKKYDVFLSKYGDGHLQEFIPHTGMQYKVAILIKNTRVINSTVLEKRRFYPISGGSSCFNKSIVQDDLVSICTKALNCISWEGFADFDLIEDPRDGLIKIMEINPRVPACLKASVISGIDFPNAIVNMSLNRALISEVYKPGKYLRYFSMDLLFLISSKGKFRIFKKWIRHMFSPDHYFQDFDMFDPVPFWAGTYFGINKVLNPKLRTRRDGME